MGPNHPQMWVATRRVNLLRRDVVRFPGRITGAGRPPLAEGEGPRARRAQSPCAPGEVLRVQPCPGRLAPPPTAGWACRAGVPGCTARRARQAARGACQTGEAGLRAGRGAGGGAGHRYTGASARIAARWSAQAFLVGCSRSDAPLATAGGKAPGGVGLGHPCRRGALDRTRDARSGCLKDPMGRALSLSRMGACAFASWHVHGHAIAPGA